MNGFLRKITILGFATLVIFSCEEPTQSNTTPPTESTTSAKAPSSVPAERPAPPLSKKEYLPTSNCETKGRYLDGNILPIKDQNILFCIIGDDSTKDEKLGDSHRVLEVYNTTNCELITKETLPVNISADFPYRIADIIYNKNSNLVAIKGFGSVYCYDLKNHQLMEALIPDFLNERIAADAQSGMIKHLEVWENYLIGYAMDVGAFVFDLTDIQNPKNLLPKAEYDLSMGEGEDFASLFFLQSQNGTTYQAISPSYNYDDGKFNVNPLFEMPKKINLNIPKNVNDNRFIVLKAEDKTAFAIDMALQKSVDLPNELKEKATQDILNWLKKSKN